MWHADWQPWKHKLYRLVDLEISKGDSSEIFNYRKQIQILGSWQKNNKEKTFRNKNDSSDPDRKYLKYGVFWFYQTDAQWKNDSSGIDINIDIFKAGL